MSNLEKLETIIHQFVDKYQALREERERAEYKANQAVHDLDKAKERIRELESMIVHLEERISGSAHFKDTKEDIIHRIESIISRINSINIEDITNDR